MMVTVVKGREVHFGEEAGTRAGPGEPYSPPRVRVVNELEEIDLPDDEAARLIALGYVVEKRSPQEEERAIKEATEAAEELRRQLNPAQVTADELARQGQDGSTSELSAEETPRRSGRR